MRESDRTSVKPAFDLIRHDVCSAPRSGRCMHLRHLRGCPSRSRSSRRRHHRRGFNGGENFGEFGAFKDPFEEGASGRFPHGTHGDVVSRHGVSGQPRLRAILLTLNWTGRSSMQHSLPGRVMSSPVSKRERLFPQKRTPWSQPSDEDVPK
jgi:hypothetical protein